MKNLIITLSLLLGFTPIYAENIDITGSVESRCLIATDTAGSYGNPNSYTLNTTPADGGRKPIVRVDVSLADAYYAQISYPTAFSTSPSLTDSVAWTGGVAVVQTSVAGMSAYQAASTTTGSMRQYALTLAGTTWFEVTSAATYGGGQNKAYPGGLYKSVVLAQCIAQ